MKQGRYAKLWVWLAGLTGSALILEGCDPQIRATVEDGIITTSTALFSSFLQAILQVSQEDTTTARLISDAVAPFLA